jgi:hypothetical protein
MLVTMDENRPLFGDARADPIGAFDAFRPNSSDPDAPVFELFGLRFLTAVVNRYSIGIAQQNDISLLADDRIKTIDFFLGRHNGFGDFPACRSVSGSNDELAQCRFLNMTCGNRVPCYPKPAMVPSDGQA